MNIIDSSIQADQLRWSKSKKFRDIHPVSKLKTEKRRQMSTRMDIYLEPPSIVAYGGYD
jgi:hypothetical protein